MAIKYNMVLNCVRKANKDRVCTKCKCIIHKGDYYRTMNRSIVHYTYCNKCIGLFLSRYSYINIINPIPRERAKEHEWNKKIISSL